MQFPKEKLEHAPVGLITDDGVTLPLLNSAERYILEQHIKEAVQAACDALFFDCDTDKLARQTVKEMEYQSNEVYRRYREYEELKDQLEELESNAVFLSNENEELMKRIESGEEVLGKAESKLKAIRGIINEYAKEKSEPKFEIGNQT